MESAWCFHPEGDPEAEQWVRAQARQILSGRAGIVAAAIRRKATYHGLDPGARRTADVAADYLLAKKPYLDYPTALARGWPIATGVIEGACRHLVKDRMDITGARWGLPGAEAILKLRALSSNGDFDRYWTWHLAQGQQRIHTSRYLDDVIPSPQASPITLKWHPTRTCCGTATRCRRRAGNCTLMFPGSGRPCGARPPGCAGLATRTGSRLRMR